MATAELPNNCDLNGLALSLASAAASESNWSEISIDLPVNGFIDVGAMAFLCAWASREAQEGRTVRLRGDASSLGYLARMDLHENIGVEFEAGNRLDETGRFLPLKQIDSDDDVFNTVNAICDLVLHQFDNANEFLPALEWAVNEIIDNIVIHSETVIPGVVCAQYFPNKHRLDVGICDLGRGIFASLATTRQLWSHGDAVTTALQRGVTRDPDVGQGNGMAGALEIAKSNGGLFHVWTGDVLFRAEKGAERGFVKIPEIPGTGVKFSLDTRRPVDLSSTWIAGGDWTFINIEAERIQESEGVNISEACINTGSRPPAERLRRKLLALLPEMEVPLVLDFKDVRAASSSFLDELLGRMAFQHELGDELFKTRIRIVGMNETMRNMANTVIAQRLGRGPIGAAEETSVEKAR